MTPLIHPTPMTTKATPTNQKRTIPLRLLGVAAAAAVMVAACGSDDSAADAGSQTEPTQATTTTTDSVSTTSEPEPVVSTTTAPDSEFIEVAFDQISVTTVLPGDWAQASDGSYTDGVAQLSVLGLPTNDPAISEALDGYQPLGEVVVGFNTWSLFTLETGDAVEGVAVTEIGDISYGFVLLSPADLADQYFQTVITPALEAFEVGAAPDGALASNSIEIDGKTISYATGGSGDTTVVFEAGLGNGMQSWALVAPDVAELSTIFAYDRPGYGTSDLTDSPRDGATMVAELRELLQATGHEPPYVLVGHSLGGTLMDLYTRTHPDEVVGLVLVDSRHHDFTARCLAQLSPAECGTISDDELEQIGQPASGEWLGLESTFQQVTEAPTFPDVPLAVIARGKPDNTPAFEELWRQTQRDYADMAPGSSLLVADNSDHHIPGRQPEVIIDSIAQVLQAQR